ncbi:glycerate kinase [Zoogloea sp.]|uniref:glycerate kinase type-2 family protein n=1 Tax=Zoogloea sp. TaxID=49181 RepID=UPI00258A0BA7|nr:glycerate kinase [Zoogloea sp.]MDD2669407.1 glycerate kinase [Zoogloea sp.]
MPSPRETLRALLDAALAAALPERVVAAHLPTADELPAGRVIVIGAGKASAAMAKAVEDHWPGDPARLGGLVITRYGHGVACRHIEIVEAAHPVPDAAGFAAARRMLTDTVHGLTADDLVLCLISGGGSALLAVPAEGLSLADKQVVGRALLASGATIAEINCVRKHLSAIKGGRLALACQPARVLTLLISDVPGDDPAIIASGPTVGDPGSCADALAVLAKYAIAVPDAVRAHLESGRGETPKPDHPAFAHCETRLIATPQMALEAAARCAAELGLTAHILSDAIEGESRDVALVHAALACQVAGRGQPFSSPCVILSGGETTVTVRGTGSGGRNVEFLVALAKALNGHPAIHALAADTDGIDGAAEIAGALIDPSTPTRAAALGRRLADVLSDNDGHGLFQALGDSVITGPTLTNVNDFRAILIDKPADKPLT